MTTGELAITCTAIIMGLGLLIGGGTTCSANHKAAMNECIKQTQKPLECKAAMGESL